MYLSLIGHDYKYAVEQILLALFPTQRPVYDDGDDDGLSAESRLTYGKVYAQSTTTIRRDTYVSRGYARVKRDKLTGKLVTDRLLQRIVKQSFFTAAARLVETPPVWGSLTGIRPARLVTAAIMSGKSEKSAEKMLIREYDVSPERARLCMDASRSAIRVMRSLEPVDAALYIGIPFCPSRCAYCSFVSNDVEKSSNLVAPFVNALLKEIGNMSELSTSLGLRIIAIYIGGGTPTALPDGDFEMLMQTVSRSFNFRHLREYTVEAGRPDTISGRKLEIMKRFGAGRVCVNPQSMSPEVLNAIGRRHGPEDIVNAALLVKKSGMSLNMDVIAGLPGDTREGFRHTLDTVLDLCPQSVTVHTLSLKKGSRIMLEDTPRPGAADVAEMLGYSSRRLRDSGMHPYYLYRQKFTSGGFENTGWSLTGHEGLYNICMMEELCPVIALGGGGVTKLVSQDGRIERIFNAKYPREYIAQSDRFSSDKMAKKIEKIRRFLSKGE